MFHITTNKKHWQSLLSVSLLCLFIFSAQAAIPDKLDYQGYLTDSSGSPINGTVNISFSLYNIDSGGIALWSDTQAVTVTNGLFNTKLGRATNPFPPGMFDMPLWLGMAVETDGEMAPRTALSSSAFAHKASDADSVGGVSAASLLQSSDLTDHSTNASAHHNKTSSFSELSGQAADAQIPATVTRDSELGSHVSDPGAHHLRYTNGEAVTAMGFNQDSNPLNHNKRSDAQVFSAVASLAGAGSMLDADMVDGLQVNEIIDAAQDEVRIPISSLPFTISAPGSYYLTGSLIAAGGGIDIALSGGPGGVTLDLMGFTMDGGGTGDHGIEIINGQNITIKNGTIVNFGNHGIYSFNSPYVTVIDIKAMGNSIGGIILERENNHVERCAAGFNGQGGIAVGDKSKVINNTTSFNNFHGIQTGMGAKVEGNTAYDNFNVGIAAGNRSSVKNNVVYDNNGTGIQAGNGSKVSRNTVSDNAGAGIAGGIDVTISHNNVVTNFNEGIWADTSANILDNTAHRNGLGGIVCGDSCMVKNNSVFQNGGEGINANVNSHVVANKLEYNGIGILAGDGTKISRNSIYNHADPGILSNMNVTISHNHIVANQEGIRVGIGASIIDNTVHNNFSAGIETTDSCLIKNNSVIGNGGGGIHVANYGRVVANTLDNNGDGIMIGGMGNVIEDNFIANAFAGIRFFISGNYYATNRATATSTPYELGGTTQTDGGGNVSF